MEPTIRDAIEAAVDAAAPTTDAPAAPPPAASSAPEAPVGQPPSEPAASGGSDRPRHPDGRFAPKAAAAEPKAAPEPPPAPTKAQPTAADAAAAAKKAADEATNATQRQALRPPQSLKPQEREAWSKADPVLQEAFVRREREVQQALQTSAGARQFTQRMTEVLNPYLPLIQANGGDPFRYVGNLLHAANALTHGAPQFKAQVVAELVRQFGVDIEMLDAALAGLPVPERSAGAPVQQLLPQVQQIVQQQLAPVQQFIGQIAQQRQQAYQRAYEAEVNALEKFASDPQHEFLDDVRDIMADLIEVAAQRGIDLSYEDAYRQACQLHPDVRKVIMSRNSNTQTQNAAQQMTLAAQRAKSAAVSVSGAPATGVPGNAPAASPAMDLRASIEAAIAAQAG
jgi:hypothetical protein